MKDLYETIVYVWYFMGCWLFLYVVIATLGMDTDLAFLVASVCWLGAILWKTFQRAKLSAAQPVFQEWKRPSDCLNCVHLSRDCHTEGYEIIYGTCNISDQEISNMSYPWQCHDYYAANQDD